MRRGPRTATEKRGLHSVALAVVEDLDWIFRIQGEEDFGIDAHIELVDADTFVTGRLIAVQVKSGESYLRDVHRHTDEPGWSYWCDSDHLAYWLGHCLPVVVTFVDEHGDRYWQVVDSTTVQETPKGCTIWVPAANRLDGTAKPRLRACVRTWRDITTRLPDMLDELPPDAHTPLQAASDVDAAAAGRLGQVLTEGRFNPAMTLSALVSHPPTWLANSPAAEQLWLTLGSYANAHQELGHAAEAFVAAADIQGDRGARSLAHAGLLLVYIDRERAASYLDQAAAGGAEILAHVGIAALSAPADDARVVDIPGCIAAASDAELDAEQTALLFLGERASRSGDLDVAVAYFERACRQDRPGGAADLQLATMLGRRARLTTGTGSSDIRRAIVLTQGVLEATRKWHGPSSPALQTLLELHLTSGFTVDALRSALPQGQGGSAQDRELTPAVARLGATAAEVLSRPDDIETFETVLSETLEGRELHQLRLDIGGRPREESIAGWRTLLRETSDDTMRARIAGRLVRHGYWPDVTDDMLARSVLPSVQYEIMQATYEACDPDGDPAAGLLRMRDLAQSTPLAAVSLISVLELLGTPDAAAICADLHARWPNETSLAEAQVGFHWRDGDKDEANALIRTHVADSRLPVETRLSMCRASAKSLYTGGDLAQSAEVARIGLAIEDDPGLGWNLVAALHGLGRFSQAREELRSRRLTPVTASEVRLWVELHLGVDLTGDDVETLIRITGTESDRRLRDVMCALLRREVLDSPGSYSSTIEGGTRAALEQAGHSTVSEDTSTAPGPVESSAQTAERLRAQFGERSLDPQTVVRWLNDYQLSLIGLHVIADGLGQAYGFALVQRPNAILMTSDLAPGLRSTGRAAVRTALTQRSCVVDLSALLSLTLLPDNHKTTIRSRLGELRLPAGFARDAAATEEQVREACSRDRLLALHASGRSTWVTQSISERARVRDLARGLTRCVDLTKPVPLPAPANGVIDQLIALAGSSTPVWCDDNAARQTLRARGTATFSTIDLLDELTADLPPVAYGACLTALARVHAVDLPLSGSQLSAMIVASADPTDDQSPGQAARLALSRPSWWTMRFRAGTGDDGPAGRAKERWSEDWRTDWARVAVAAAGTGADGFLATFGSALAGLSQVDEGGRQAQSQLDLFVLTLTACWQAVVEPPASLLDGFDSDARSDMGNDSVHAALINRLRHLGADDPAGTAWRLLHPATGASDAEV